MGAQAIGNELALLGQKALDELKRGPVPEEAHLEEGFMPEPVAPGLEIQREPVAPLQVEPDVSDGDDTPPGTGGSGRRRETLEAPVSARAESPAPPGWRDRG